MRWNVSGTTFVEQLRERVARYAAAPAKTTGVLRVPEEHKWWYFQEVGYPAGYPIFPVNQKRLAWTDAEGKHVVSYVHEWGSDTPDAGHAKEFVLSAMPEIREQTKQLAQQILETHEPQMIRILLLDGLLPSAKSLILQNVQERLPGSRPGSGEPGDPPGKLGGRTAADVLNEVITIESEEG